MTLPDTISREESVVLGTFKRLGRPMGEDVYHMLHQVMDLAGRGLGLEYQLTYWHDVDKGFNSIFGTAPYSQRLHDIIESLVERGQLKRNPENPIELEYYQE